MVRPLKEEDCVELRIFDRDVEDGARGCYTSHMAIYKELILVDVSVFFSAWGRGRGSLRRKEGGGGRSIIGGGVVFPGE